MLHNGDLVCLSGDLGAGKTTMVQGVTRGWGSADAVSSPTFVLVNGYRRGDGQVLHHMDAYRMESSAEAVDLDVTLMLEQGPLLVEWPERIPGALPAECLWIDMRWVADEQRGMILLGRGKHYEKMLAELRHKIYGGA
jgi:tRNA threonylcarbamoyladenosine biosynthesis protein TsaE